MFRGAVRRNNAKLGLAAERRERRRGAEGSGSMHLGLSSFWDLKGVLALKGRIFEELGVDYGLLSSGRLRIHLF